MMPRIRAILLVAAILLVGTLVAQANGRTPANGSVPDETTALRIPEAVVVALLGEREVAGQHPFTASLIGDFWYVNGTVPKDAFGEPLHVQLSKQDGRIVEVH